jgi:hypothetical protein
MKASSSQFILCPQENVNGANIWHFSFKTNDIETKIVTWNFADSLKLALNKGKFW